MPTSSIPVQIPLLNPNEPEAMLAGLHVSEGQQVSQGDLLCTLETTKSAADIYAESAGYVVGLRYRQGQTANAGDVLCYLAGSPDWEPPHTGPQGGESAGQPQIPEGLRITRPALALAQQNGLDLERLPIGPMITESLVRSYLDQNAAQAESGLATGAFDPQAILVYGGGGHGKMLIDLLRALGAYRIVGIVDDGLSRGASVMGVPVLGGSEQLAEIYMQGVRLAVNAVGGIGNINVRIHVFQRLAQAGFAFPVVVHPTAYVEPSASLSPGAQVFARAYVGSQANIGLGAIVNTGVIISHDCILGAYANISPGAMLAGEVQVGSGALVGMGTTINLQVKIGAGARLGNGATVKTDVPEKGIVRAGKIWPE